MSELAGRKIQIFSNAALIASARTKSVKINNEPIDITTDDDNGFQTLLETDVAQSSIEVGIEGLLADSDLLTKAVNRSGLAVDAVVSIPGHTDVSFRALLTSFELGAPYNDAVTFSATLKSTGPWTPAVST